MILRDGKEYPIFGAIELIDEPSIGDSWFIL